MKPSVVFVGVITALISTQNVAISQETGIASLKRELDLLKRENDLLKRENDLLKQEVASLKKGSSTTPSEVGADAAFSVTIDNVEYKYQGMVRSGEVASITLLATSRKGENPAPNGMMTLMDDDGDKYQGMPLGGFGARQVLREGVPAKLVWRFGPNPLTRKGSAPSATIKRFASLSVAPTVGDEIGTIEFRDVPAAVVPKSQSKK